MHNSSENVTDFLAPDTSKGSGLKDSEASNTRNTNAVSFVNKNPFGMADTDEVDEDTAGLIADKTPQTQRRIIKEEN